MAKGKSKLNTRQSITMDGGKISVSDTLKSDIFDLTGNDRADLLQKVSEKVNGSLGSHRAEVRQTNDIKIGDYTLDVTTRKIKGTQKVTAFMVWKTNDRKTIKSFYRD